VIGPMRNGATDVTDGVDGIHPFSQTCASTCRALPRGRR
jgi:hypothetical protein